VRSALTAAVTTACAGDDWLAQHPPSWTWLLDYPPLEIRADAPILASVLTAASAASGEACPVGLDSGYDGAPLGALYGIPAPAFGPGGIAQAHADNEYVEIGELVTAARAYARLMIEWCGLG
jgi:acetylornithine deacetylase/succinyl-diaminopimelate desuccinylase-like protein